MRYGTAAAFRAALDDRLKVAASGKGATSLTRLRKIVVFDRLMARLLVAAPDRWVVKGGVALDLRLGDRARMTKDLDIARIAGSSESTSDLIDAQAIDLGDFFVFSIEKTERTEPDHTGDLVRYRVQAELAGRTFDAATLDVGIGDPLPSSPDHLLGTDLLDFSDLPRIVVPALPLEWHVAEKLHAYTKGYPGDRASTRVKDLIDLALICGAAPFDSDRLRRAIVATFEHRRTHPVPVAVPRPPAGWSTPYRTLARDLGLDPNVAAGHRLVATFLDPVIGGPTTAARRWEPETGAWNDPGAS